ncbi:hypothetical protein [Dermatobacter hominis]|uniref:hypothetical protein n=1 Tax=Dermatobacter hominis TaxID=2884263 RepID=UPI001D11F46A|nr:hypothetical protein [Dermatobacter hominis]UDY37321.1 hypothetical protein LH044_07230 [Dermatobacter hominis]
MTGDETHVYLVNGGGNLSVLRGTATQNGVSRPLTAVTGVFSPLGGAVSTSFDVRDGPIVVDGMIMDLRHAGNP